MRPRRQILKRLEALHAEIVEEGIDGFACKFKVKNSWLYIIASWGRDWDHVSVHVDGRCPCWDEMCVVKQVFWHENECIMQLHPDSKRHVNIHPTCLHLWKPQQQKIPQPPLAFV